MHRSSSGGRGRYAAEEALVSKIAPPSHKSLKKTLFPSSSPSQGSQDGSIKNAFARAAPLKPSIPKFAPPSRALSTVSNTVANRPPQSTVTASSAFISACKPSSDPFKDEPCSATPGKENTEWIKEFIPGFDENDFDDDFDPDLEFELPKSLPPSAAPPPLPRPLPDLKKEPLTEQPSSPETNIPWTSSPASHMLPPTTGRSASGSSESSSKKRSSTDSVEISQSMEPPKRRKLPGSLLSNPDSVNEHADTTRTPAPRERKYNPIEATASAMKEQRKQYRQRLTADDSSTGKSLTAEEMREITSAGAKPIESIFLSQEQRNVLELVTKQNRSVFFTGPAGTGKSVLMRSIILELKKKWARDPERLAVTASTGLAACNIGGITLHSFSGIGLGKEDVPTLVKKIRRNPKAKGRWLKTKCLIIDEISMVDGELFDKLSEIGRIIRNKGQPWGGIQLVITGDFFQLPPVPDGQSRASKFAFEAGTWGTSIDHTIGLTQVFRQKDPTFAEMLNEMRLGKISDQTERAFKSLTRPLRFDDDIDTTELFPTRMEVEGSNQRRLRELPGESHRFEAVDSGDPNNRDRLLQNMMCPRSLELKVGAQVMLIKNVDEQLVNGTIGKVKRFETQLEWEIGGGVSRADDYDLAGLETAKKKLKNFVRDAQGDAQRFPIIEFLCTDGSRRTLQVLTDEWKVELPNGEVQAKRSQLPLILAWALSIHKAQGQTLERVKVDLGKVFEKGQAYVALSRATSQQGLQVLRFEKHKVMAHPKVVMFYDRLYSVEDAMSSKKPRSVADMFQYVPGRS